MLYMYICVCVAVLYVGEGKREREHVRVMQRRRIIGWLVTFEGTKDREYDGFLWRGCVARGANYNSRQ